MKIEPISRHERTIIVQHLKAQGRWKATRMGAHVCIIRFRARQTPTGPLCECIRYSVNRGYETISKRAATVGAAVDQINSIIQGVPLSRPKRKPKLQPPFVPRSGPSAEWLPYKDA